MYVLFTFSTIEHDRYILLTLFEGHKKEAAFRWRTGHYYFMNKRYYRLFWFKMHTEQLELYDNVWYHYIQWNTSTSFSITRNSHISPVGLDYKVRFFVCYYFVLLCFCFVLFFAMTLYDFSVLFRDTLFEPVSIGLSIFPSFWLRHLLFLFVLHPIRNKFARIAMFNGSS